MATVLRVLHVEGNPFDAELVLAELRSSGFEPDSRRVETEPDYLAHLDPAPDVILADYDLPGWDGLKALRLMQERGLDIPFILVTGTLGDELAAECVKRGADDYIIKDRMARLGLAVENALEQKWLRDQKRKSEATLRDSEKRYRTLFQDSRDGIFIINLDGTFVDVNQAFLGIFGYTRENLLKINVVDFYTDPADRGKYQLAVEDSGSVKDYEMRMRKWDGTEIDCLVTSSARRSSDGTILAYQGIVRDVTVQKREHQELDQKVRELEALNKQFQEYLVESYAAVDSYKEVCAGLQALAQEAQTLYTYMRDQDQYSMSDTERQSFNRLQELASRASALLQKAQSQRSPIQDLPEWGGASILGDE